MNSVPMKWIHLLLTNRNASWRPTIDAFGELRSAKSRGGRVRTPVYEQPRNPPLFLLVETISFMLFCELTKDLRVLSPAASWTAAPLRRRTDVDDFVTIAMQMGRRQLPGVNAEILIHLGMCHLALLDGEAYAHVRIIDLEPLLLNSCR